MMNPLHTTFPSPNSRVSHHLVNVAAYLAAEEPEHLRLTPHSWTKDVNSFTWGNDSFPTRRTQPISCRPLLQTSWCWLSSLMLHTWLQTAPECIGGHNLMNRNRSFANRGVGALSDCGWGGAGVSSSNQKVTGIIPGCPSLVEVSLSKILDPKFLLMDNSLVSLWVLWIWGCYIILHWPVYGWMYQVFSKCFYSPQTRKVLHKFYLLCQTLFPAWLCL